MPLIDVGANVGAVVPEHIGLMVSNVGVIIVTVTFKVVAKAHKPAVGVKVYVPEAVLLIVNGFHVPVIPSKEVEGKLGGVVK